MIKFFIRDYDSPNGYSESPFSMETLRRVRGGQNYVPWAVTSDYLTVIYAVYGEHRGFNRNTGLKQYDTYVSQIRQKFCTSELAIIALSGRFTTDAVKKVSDGVKSFLLRKVTDTQTNFKEILFEKIGHYFYTNNAMGYGRISTMNKNDIHIDYFWDKIISTLTNGNLEQQLAIHDAVGRKLLLSNDFEKNEYNFISHQIREPWFDDQNRRGRKKSELAIKRQVIATEIPGIIPFGTESGIASIQQKRHRGIDMFERDTNRISHPKANEFYDELDTHNFVFSAGISGTTGTLLQAARAFGKISDGEDLKQYTLAIVAYLLGGGMHSYHEVMVIAKRVGISYFQPGIFDWLPFTFTSSPEFLAWNYKYYDVTTLGATHWLYNPGVIPSHLNHQLRNSTE